MREDKQAICKAAYVVLGVNMDGEKEVLGIWVGANDVLIFCVDGLKGFKEAISADYPVAKIQRCIVRQLRYGMKYIPHKDKKAFARDMKAVYPAVNEDVALERLLEA